MNEDDALYFRLSPFSLLTDRLEATDHSAYFYNKRTGASQWEEPDEMKRTSEKDDCGSSPGERANVAL